MKLSKLSMPKKKSDAEMADDYGLELAPEEGSEAEESAESPEEEAAEAPTEDMGNSMLADVPDEELLAEIQKRGLESKLGAGKKPGSMPPDLGGEEAPEGL